MTGFPDDQSIQTLLFPQYDAKELAKVLEDPETCGFEAELYLNKSSWEIAPDMEMLSGELTADDTLLFYYSGHGKLSGSRICVSLQRKPKQESEINLDSSVRSPAQSSGKWRKTTHIDSRLLLLRSDCKRRLQG